MELTQEFVDRKLLEIGDKLLNKRWKKEWIPERPATGYCYIVTEAIYHYYADNTYMPICISYPNDEGTHWYLKSRETGHILDFTVSQFTGDIGYEMGKGCGFFKGSIKTPKGYISKRGYEIAKLLELV